MRTHSRVRKTAHDAEFVGPRHVRAICVVERKRGGSQAQLVLTTDGPYVVKWQHNTQHRRILINEHAGAMLLRVLGISSPQSALVHVDSEFIQDNPMAGVVLANGSLKRVEAGPHFGSKVPVDYTMQTIYDFLPTPSLRKVINLRDFISVFVFDRWIDNTDGRQAIFYRSASRRFLASMIDNGHVLGFDGMDWRIADRIPSRPSNSLLTELLLADAESSPRYTDTIMRIQQLTATDLNRIQESIPAEWVGNDSTVLSRVFEMLIARAIRLPEIVAESYEYLRAA